MSVIFFSFYLFPTGKIQEYIMMTFIRALPDYQLMIENAKPAFPIALKLSNVKIFRLNKEFIEAASVKIGFPVSSLFSSERSFSIKSRVYDGTVSGTISITEKNNVQSVSGKFRLTDIKIETVQPLQQELKEKIAGTLRGTVTFNGRNPGNTANFNLTLADAVLPLAISFIRLGEVTFNEINIEGSLSNQNLSIGKCVFHGPRINGRFSGEITLKDPVQKSLLNLSGTVKPHHDLLKNLPGNMIPANLRNKEGVPFKISGTYEKPGLSFR